MAETKAKKRNTKGIWFNEEEYAEIQAQAKKMGLFPRQLIMLKIKGKV